MATPLFAGGDIRGPSVFAGVVLLGMIGYFRWRALRGTRKPDRTLVCMTVLIAGPLFSVLYFLADAHFVSKYDFIPPDDYWGELISLAALGVAAGFIASAVLWIGLSASKPQNSG